MSIGSVAEYLERQRIRYLVASKKQKGVLLDEVCQALRYHRKAAIRALRQPAGVERRRPGRPAVYSALVNGALVQVWEIADQACGKRLAPFMAELVAALERAKELRLDPAVRAQLLALSPATIDRRLAAQRRTLGRQPYRGRTPPGTVKALIPIRTFGEWAGVAPGSFQADLVLHCGASVAGFYLTTLVATDVASGWTECEPISGLGRRRVSAGLHQLQGRLPVAMRELHTDNGSEFINAVLFPYCQRAGIALTRGRPYKKNDQAFVEERNGAVVRRLVGYDRFCTRPALALLAQYYELLRLYLNFFQPMRKLVAKERHGAKVHKVYDEAATPYRRLLASGVLSREHQ